MAELAPNIWEQCAYTPAKPILKWAGGKTQILPAIRNRYPKLLIQGSMDTYIEPFVGSAVVFFDIIANYPLKRAIICDANPELGNLYLSLQMNVEQVIHHLEMLAEGYLELQNAEREAEYFYKMRLEFNQQVSLAHQAIYQGKMNYRRAALIIFLNRTCFNGLFRVNQKGEFNVPHGRYKNPTILFADNLRSVAYWLGRCEIIISDFQNCENLCLGNTFIYYDPPYRPLNKTSQFTAYSKDSFNDEQQKLLAELYRRLDKRGVYQLLSNSDPNNYGEDRFFDDLYEGFTIDRVDAKRIINSKASGRGTIKEILVRNYP